MSDDDRAAMAARVREAREYRGFSQDEVAKYLGIPRSAISLIETGVRKVDAIEVRKLARLFGCTTDELTGAEPQETRNTAVQFIARAAADLTDEDRAEVLRFAEFLRSRREKKP